ncbi:MAG: DUF58 domain-containing protein [Nitrososphaerales archaeon]|nr:DUF58 domain-containing protein [Nitrososphaerales archaeon]
MKLTTRGSTTAYSLSVLTVISWIIHDSMFIATSTVLFLLFIIEAVRFYLLSRELNKLKFERNVSQRVAFVGDVIDVTLTIKNMGSKCLSRLDIEDELPNTFLITSGFNRALIKLDGNGEYELKYKAIPLENGQHIFKGILTRLYDPLMLFWTLCEFELTTTIKVYPKVEFLRTIKRQRVLLPRPHFEGYQLYKKGVGTEFYEIRKYNPGDDYRLIAWKATAHSPEYELMTKLQEKYKITELFIVICNEKSMGDGYVGKRKITKVVEAALSLVILAGENSRINLIFFNHHEKVQIESCMGKNRFVRALNILNTIQPVNVDDPLKVLDYLIMKGCSKALIFIILNPLSHIKPLLSKLKVIKGRQNFIHLFILNTLQFLPPPDDMSIKVKDIYDLLSVEERLKMDEFVSSCISEGIVARVCGPDDLLSNIINQYKSLTIQV